MANTKEIKTRIESVKDTRKITNAMYLIASTKLRKARNDLDRTRPYFEALRTEIKRIFRTQNDVDSRYFYPPEGEPPLEGTYACLVITADKGLAGAYNQNVIKEAMHMLDEHPDTKLYVLCTLHASAAVPPRLFPDGYGGKGGHHAVRVCALRAGGSQQHHAKLRFGLYLQCPHR